MDDDDAYATHLRRMMREKQQAEAAGAAGAPAGARASAAGPARPTSQQYAQSRSSASQVCSTRTYNIPDTSMTLTSAHNMIATNAARTPSFLRT
jgi:hypothetical protein